MVDCMEKPDVVPVCPHCEAPLTEVWFRLLRSTFGKRYVYFCSNCHRVLGISHRKGFWMG